MHFRLTFLTFLLLSGTLYAQSPWVKKWDKRFGGTNTDGLTSAVATSDGGLVLAGHSWSPVSGDKSNPNCGANAADYWIVKTDSLGGKLWDRTYGGNLSEHFSSMIELPSGNLMLAGFSFSDSTCDRTFPNQDTSGNNYDYWIILVDSVGNKIWDHAFGGYKDDKLQQIQNTIDGGFILGGVSWSDSGGDKSQNNWPDPITGNATLDYWIIKTDPSGNKLWDRNYGGTSMDQLTCLDNTSDGGFIFGGFSRSGISGDKSESSFDTSAAGDYWIIKTDSLGNKQWDRTYGGLNQDKLFAIHQLSDGGYILGGYSNSGIGGNKSTPGNGGYDYWIIRTDSSGNIIWDKSLGGIEDENEWTIYPWFDAGFLVEDKDGGFIMSGASESGISGDKTESNLGARQIWVVKTDASGNKIWDKTIFTNAVEENGIMIPMGDTCFVIATATDAGIGGYKTEPNQGLVDYWSVVFCQPTVSTGINTISDFQPLIYPNPSNNDLNISIPDGFDEEITVTIYDVPGRKVRYMQFTGSTEANVADFDKLSNGIYSVELVTGQNRYVQRIVKN